MAGSNLTKKDLFDFVMLGKKIVTSGAGTVLDAAKSKIAELTNSEEAFQKRVAAKMKAFVDAGCSETEARKAIDDLFRGRLDRAFEKCAKPTGDSITEK